MLNTTDKKIQQAVDLLQSNHYLQHIQYNLIVSLADAMQQKCNCADGEYLFLIQQAQKELKGISNAN